MDEEISLGTPDSPSGGSSGLNWTNLLSSALTGAGNAYAASQRPRPATSPSLAKILPIALIGVVVIVVAMVAFRKS
jgi:hypothetical protein